MLKNMYEESIKKYIESVKEYEFDNEEQNMEYKEMAVNILKEDNLVSNLSREQVEYMCYYLTKRKLIDNDIKRDVTIEKLEDKTIGIHNNNKISYNSKYIEIAANAKGESRFNIFDIMKTINHEVEHAVQKEKMKTETYDYNAIRYTKEDICYSLYGDSFYKNNYWNINFEHDANIAGYLNTLEDLKELAPHYVEKYDVICKGNCSELKNKLNKGELEFEAYGEKIVDQKNLATTAGINLAIRNKGNEIILNNPLLLKEYNIDGSKKNYNQLNTDRQRHISNLRINSETDDMVNVQGEQITKAKAIEKEYNDIINSDPLLQVQRLERHIIRDSLYDKKKNPEKFEQISKITKNATINYKDIMNYEKDRVNELKKEEMQLKRKLEKGEIKSYQYTKEICKIYGESNLVRDIYSQVISDNENLDEQRKKSTEDIKEMNLAKKILKEKYNVDFDMRQDSEKNGFVLAENGLQIKRYNDEEFLEIIAQIKTKNQNLIRNYGMSKKAKQLDQDNILINKLYDELSDIIETENIGEKIETKFKDEDILSNISKNDFRSNLKEQVVDDKKYIENIADDKNKSKIKDEKQNLNNNNVGNINNER